MVADSARPVDVVIHSLANGPEVAKPLLDTTREGYLAALSASSYSFVSMVRRFAPLMRAGQQLPVAHLRGQRTRHSALRRRHVVGQGRAREPTRVTWRSKPAAASASA